MCKRQTLTKSLSVPVLLGASPKGSNRVRCSGWHYFNGGKKWKTPKCIPGSGGRRSPKWLVSELLWSFVDWSPILAITCWPSLRSARIVQPWRETLLNRNLAGGHKLSQVLRKPFCPTTLVPGPDGKKSSDAQPSRFRFTRKILSGFVAFLLVGVITWGLLHLRNEEARSVRSSGISPNVKRTPLVTLRGLVSGITFSPDGQQIAFTWSKFGKRDIYLSLIHI